MSVVGHSPVSAPKRRLLHPISKRGAEHKSCHQRQEREWLLSPMGTPISSQSCNTPCWQAKPVPYLGQPQLQGHWFPNTHLSDSKSWKTKQLDHQRLRLRKRGNYPPQQTACQHAPHQPTADWEGRQIPLHLDQGLKPLTLRPEQAPGAQALLWAMSSWLQQRRPAGVPQAAGSARCQKRARTS